MRPSSVESFPRWMVAVCNAVNLFIEAIGVYLMACLGWVWAAVYVAYCLLMEWRLLRKGCRYCFYYGKLCVFGRGRVAAWLLPRGGEDFGANATSVSGASSG